MPAQKINEEMLRIMKILVVKGMLSCEEAAKRLDISRQSVALAMKKAGINMAKRKVVVPCSQCDTPVEKIRSEVRKYEHHFCSPECYNEWIRRPDVQADQQRTRVLVEKASNVVSMGFNGEGVRVHDTGNDILVFPSREALLEWKRTGLPMKALSVKKGEEVEVIFPNK